MPAPTRPSADKQKKARIEVAQMEYDAALNKLKGRAIEVAVVWEERTALEDAAAEFSQAEAALEKAKRS